MSIQQQIDALKKENAGLLQAKVGGEVTFKASEKTGLVVIMGLTDGWPVTMSKNAFLKLTSAKNVAKGIAFIKANESKLVVK